MKTQYLLGLIALGLGQASADQVYYNSTAYQNGAYGVAPVQTFVTRPDLQPPALDILTTSDPSLYAAGNYFLTIAGYSLPYLGAVIMDSNGSMIYGTRDTSTVDFQVQTYQGQPVLTYYLGPIDLPGVGSGQYVVLNQSYDIIRNVQVQNFGQNVTDFHEMIITPEDTFLVQTWNVTQADLTSQDGPVDGYTYDCVIQEVDDNNDVLFQWNSLDWVDVGESYFSTAGTGYNSSTPYDYCHSNSIEKDDDGTYLISLRGTAAIYKVNGTDGSIVWQLSGKSSDFAMGDNATFWYQHDARWLNDSSVNPRYMSIFDNAGAGTEAAEPYARGIILAIDQDAMTADLAMAYPAPTGQISGSQGSTSVMDNGNVVVGWGSQATFTEFAQDGTILWDNQFSNCTTGQCNVFSYRAFKQVWYGSPTTSPDVAFNSSTMYWSWNGATNVTEWAMLSGNSASSLASVANIQRNGFEMNSTYPTDETFVAIAGLDSAGTCLGISNLFYAFNETDSGLTAECSALQL